ncbi:MAG: hypothetical protein ACUZ8H_15930 [Candidatus Anammoxibacter sp.]
MSRITLHINSPAFGLCVTGDTLEVEVFAMSGHEHCDHEYIVQTVGKQNDVYITIDGKFVAIARYITGKKATYAAKINLINFLEGRHAVKASFPKESYTKTDEVPESAPVEFVVDNTPPSIRSVFPSNIVRLKDADVFNSVAEAGDVRSGIDVNKCSVTFDLCLIIEAEDVCSGIDVDNCTASLDGQSLEKPTIHKNGVVFPLANESEVVSHKLKAIIQDRAGNKAEYESDVIIDNSTLLISDVVVETEKPVFELDLQRCGISIDGKPSFPPSYEMNCLVFPLEMKLKDIQAGQHKITISIFDITGNVTEYNSEFFVGKKEPVKDERPTTALPDKDKNVIIPDDVTPGEEVCKPNRIATRAKVVGNVRNGSAAGATGKGIVPGKKAAIPKKTGLGNAPQTKKNAPVQGEAQTQLRKDMLLKALRGKLVTDRQFLKHWLKAPSDITAKIGLRYTVEMGKYLPPVPPEGHIDFSIKAGDDNAAKIVVSLMTRVTAAIRKKTPSSLHELGEDGVYTVNGAFTNSARNTINALLQDPVGMLESVGIELTDEERDVIFPPFPKTNAEELTGWISLVQTDGN